MFSDSESESLLVRCQRRGPGPEFESFMHHNFLKLLTRACILYKVASSTRARILELLHDPLAPAMTRRMLLLTRTRAVAAALHVLGTAAV